MSKKIEALKEELIKRAESGKTKYDLEKEFGNKQYLFGYIAGLCAAIKALEGLK